MRDAIRQMCGRGGCRRTSSVVADRHSSSCWLVTVIVVVVFFLTGGPSGGYFLVGSGGGEAPEVNVGWPGERSHPAKVFCSPGTVEMGPLHASESHLR